MSLVAMRLSQIWDTIQGKLFPLVEETVGELSEKQRRLISILELVRIESYVTVIRGWPGRPAKDRAAIARSFVAKAVYNMGTTRDLLERLKSDPTGRCSFHRAQRVLSRRVC